MVDTILVDLDGRQEWVLTGRLPLFRNSSDPCVRHAQTRSGTPDRFPLILREVPRGFVLIPHAKPEIVASHTGITSRACISAMKLGAGVHDQLD